MYEFKKEDAYSFVRHIGIKAKERGDELTFKHCPYCQGGVGKADPNTFSINLKTGQFKCLRASCGISGNMVTLSRDFDFSLGSMFDEYYRPKKKYRTFKRSEAPVIPKPEAISYLESRGISKEIAELYEITTKKEDTNIIVFPFYDEKGILQFIKYRKANFDKAKDKNKEWSEAHCKPILFGMKQCVNFDRLVITEGQCFNGDAEVMTQEGWVRLENYSGQQVLQVNDDLSGNFVKPKAYIVKRHIGKMVDVSVGGNYFSSTTDDHNLVFQTAKGKLIKKKAIEKISTAYHIPTAINYSCESNDWTNDEIALFIAISADGTLDFRKNTGYNKSGTNVYVRFGLTKQRKVDRLIGILERLGFKYSDSILSNGRGKQYHSICFGVPDKFNSKFLPWWFVTSTTIEQKKFIIEEMVYWDGNKVNNRNQYEYMSIYKHNADVIQAVASTCGYMSTIMHKSSGGNDKFRAGYIYKVSVLLNKRNVSTQQFEKHKVVYEADRKVYCVTVDSGMILVRQNNKISVSGNCDSLALSTAGIENAVSVPTGAKGFTWLPYCWNWINQFEEVVVFGDYEKGEITLLDELSKRLKVTVKHVREEDYKDCKDANEILLKYGKEQIIKCVENAVTVPIKQVIDLADVENINIYKIPKVRTGITQVDKLLRGGLPMGGVVLVSAKPGSGKSTLASQMLVSAIEQGYKCFAYSGELPNYLFKAWMDFQLAGPHHVYEGENPYGDREYGISELNRRTISEWYRGKCYLYDNSAIDGEEKESLISVVENTVMQYGVKVVLLDNLMTALDLEAAPNSDKYEKQSIFVKRLTRLALKHNIVVILVAHKRKNNFSTNENDEISGSADISNLATITISYDKSDDILPEQRICKVSKNRLFGKTNTKGYVLDYDERSKRIFGKDDDLYVEYGWNKDINGFYQVEIDTPFDEE